MTSAKLKKNKHQKVRFAVKQRYEILAEMSVLAQWQINLAYSSPTI